MPLLSQKRVSQTNRQDSSTSDLGGATNHSMSTYRDGSPRTGRTFNSSIDVRWGTQTTLLSSMRTNQSSSPRRSVHHTTRTRGPIQLIPSDFSDPTSLYSNLLVDGTESVSALRGLNTTTSNRAATIGSVPSPSATRKLSYNHTIDHILPTATTQPPVSYPLSTWGPNTYTSTSNTPSSSSWADDATQASLLVSPPLLLQSSSPAQLSSRPSSAAPTCTYIGTHPTTFGLRAAQAAQMSKVGGRGATYTLDKIASILVRYKGSSGPVARRAKRGRRRDVSSTIHSRFGRAVPTSTNERLLSCTKFIRTVLGTFASHNTPETSILLEPLGCLWYIDSDATPDMLDGTRPRQRQSRIGFNPSPLCSQLLPPCDPNVPPRSPAVSILVSAKSPHNHCTPTPRLESPRVTFTTTYVEDGEGPVVSLSPFSRQAPTPTLLDASPQAMLMGPPVVSRTQELPRTDEDTTSTLYHHPNAPISEESPCQGARSPITIGANSSMYVDILSPPTTIHEGDNDPSEDDEDLTRRLLVLGEEDGDEMPLTPSGLSTSNETPPPVSLGPGAKYHKGSRATSHPHRSDDINTAGGCGVAGCTIQ